MKKTLLCFALCFQLAATSYPQVGINSDGSQPDQSSILDVKSTSKGLLPPRMNIVQRDAIANPAEGLAIYNTDCNDLQFFNGAGWVPVGNTGMLETPGPVAGNQAPCVNATGAVYSISSIPGATGYNWIIPPGALITGGNGTTSITVSFGTASGSICVAAYNQCYKSNVGCCNVTLTLPPATPVASTQVASPTQVVWNWNTVPGATGYKWGAAQSYAAATDLGTATSTTETGLTCNTSYTRYVWAYNNCGYVAPATLTQTTSPCQVWSCGQTLTDARDSKTYSTVLIGTQCWMAQSLNYGTKIDGTVSQLNNGIPEKYCYNNDESVCAVYGGLYQWDELMQYVTTSGAQGLCPSGWHLPNDGDWTTLTTFLGGETVAGGKIKEAGTAHWQAPNTGATNISGFTALPGGYRDAGSGFNGLNGYLNYWSSSMNGGTEAWDRHLNYYSEYVARGNYSRSYGFYARCLKDAGSVTGQPCPGIPTVTFEGHVYNTVMVGSQCWLKENLNVGVKIDGPDNQTNNNIREKYCYANLESNCDVYGGLYQWDEAMQYTATGGAQGLCPPGWHIPQDASVTALLAFLGGEAVAGGKLKEVGTTHWVSPNTGATNTSGFTALPASSRATNGAFYGIGGNADFWTSTLSDTGSAWYLGLNYVSETAFHSTFSKVSGFSIRCMKD